MAGDMLSWLVAVAAIGGMVELALTVVAARNRDTPGAAAFGWLTFAAAGWSFLQVTYLLATDETVMRLAYRLAEPVSYQVAMLWLVFAIVYTGHREWLTPRRLVALWTPLSLYLVVRWTAPVHGVFAAPMTIETVSGVTAPVVAQTPSVIGARLFGYCYVFAGFALLFEFLSRSRNVYRRQAGAIILGAVFPTVATLAFTARVTFHPGVSPSPQAFAIHGIVTGLALFRYDFLSVSPVATDLLAEELGDPVLVLDEEGVVVDHNPAAARLADGERLINRPLGALVPALDGVTDGPDDGVDDHRITMDAPGDDRPVSVFSVTVSGIDDQYGATQGYLALMRDVSDQQHRLDQLTAMQAATQQFISARTPAEVADIAVRFVGDVHDQPYAALFRYEEEADALVAVATTDELSTATDGGEEALSVDRGEDALWRAFEDGASTVYAGDRPFLSGAVTPEPTSALVLPLGEHGVLVIATDDDREYNETDEQLGEILARTTETALTRVEHEGELRASRIAVERRNKQIEFFNGVLRHNIRNAMLVIDGHADHLRSQVPDADREKLDTIREWCRDLTDLTEKIRAVNDTVTASENERLEPVDLAALLDDAVADLSDRHEAVAVESDVADELTVAANDLVADVLSGVLSNAVEHNDATEPRVTVSTETVGDEWVQVRIADNGPGLSEEMQTQVFQREMATSQTAHGFGLYFVSVMMDLYDGNVWFEDNDPRGTVVVLEFQLAGEAFVEPAP